MQVTRVRSRMSGDMMTLFLLALAIFSAARELHHARMSVGMCVALQSAYLEGLGLLQAHYNSAATIISYRSTTCGVWQSSEAIRIHKREWHGPGWPH